MHASIASGLRSRSGGSADPHQGDHTHERQEPGDGGAADDPKVVVERTYRAKVGELWNLWTTKEGFESWWGPKGCRRRPQDSRLPKLFARKRT